MNVYMPMHRRQGARERVCMEDVGAAADAAVDEAFSCTGRRRAGVLGYSPSS